MRYVSKTDESVEVDVREVKENTTIKHPEYGDILVTPGNYILKQVGGADEGREAGISKTDLEAQYEPLED